LTAFASRPLRNKISADSPDFDAIFLIEFFSGARREMGSEIFSFEIFLTKRLGPKNVVPNG
jgi:hypothetical protein